MLIKEPKSLSNHKNCFFPTIYCKQVKMAKVVKLTESDLIRLVNKVINEQNKAAGPIDNIDACIAKKFSPQQIQKRLEDLSLNLMKKGYEQVKKNKNADNPASNWLGIKRVGFPFLWQKFGSEEPVVWMDSRWTNNCPVIYIYKFGKRNLVFIMDDGKYQDLLTQL